MPSSTIDRVSALKQWDPDNALPHLIAAQKIGVTVTHSKEFPLGKVEESPAWEKEMSAAFLSPKLDNIPRPPKAIRLPDSFPLSR